MIGVWLCLCTKISRTTLFIRFAEYVVNAVTLRENLMINGIQYIGTNLNSVLEFCGAKAYFVTQLRVNSVKENLQLVRPSDFIFKSSLGNLLVVPREQFFTFFKQNDTFEPIQLTHSFILK